MSNKMHVVLPGSNRPAKADASRVADVNPDACIEVTLTLRAPELPKSSDRPEKSLTRKQLESQFGARPEDAQKVKQVLEGFGLKIEEVSLATCSMRVSGTAAQMEAAFRPKLGIYKSADQGEFRGRTGDIAIPAELSGIVLGVFGLDERRVARRKATATARKGGATRKPIYKAVGQPKAAGKLTKQTPADLEARYNFPPGNAKGQQIAIAEFQGGYFTDDVAAYCSKYNRAVPSVQTVPVGRPAFTLQQILALPPTQRKEELDASIEVMMDVQIIAGLCSGAELFVYFAPFTQKGWIDLLNKVISGGTSASAPLLAALIARINALLPAAKQQRFLTPLLYQSGPGGTPVGQTACRDVTIGHNASNPSPGVGYKAEIGFDAVSGWGVPNGQALLQAL